ncbi:MAG: hypothetical protein VB013_03075 [Anaerolineaceae bacterium]|nr:hypothetical protein [Anaerolineaceae bacterium]
MTQWLYERFKTEDPRRDWQFSLMGTLNWARSLALHVSEGFSRDEIVSHYLNVARLPIDKARENKVFENLVLAFHCQSSLHVMGSKFENIYSINRSAVVSWYYGLYYAAKAMIAAVDGSSQEIHAKVATTWRNQIVLNSFAIPPFSYQVDTLVKAEYEDQIGGQRGGNPFDLRNVPEDFLQAKGGCLTYLKGTADWYRKKAEEEIKRNHRLTNFRTKEARRIRDESLSTKSACFMHQAFRFRGKTNYRDALYLSYGGQNRGSSIERFVNDLTLVLDVFLKMTCGYVGRRIHKKTWEDFLEDIRKHARFELYYEQ